MAAFGLPFRVKVYHSCLEAAPRSEGLAPQSICARVFCGALTASLSSPTRFPAYPYIHWDIHRDIRT